MNLLLRLFKNGIEIRIPIKWWPWKPNIVGVALPPFIFYRGTPTEDTIVHERDHMAFAREHFIIGFYILYIWYAIRYGYWKNPIEVRAHLKEKEEALRKKEEADANR